MIPLDDHPGLPALDEPFALDGDVAVRYRRDGHALIRGLATAAEVEAYRPHILAACERLRYDVLPLAERDAYGRAFLQYWGLANEDSRVARFVLARRFAGVAARLMGVDGVRLYHDQALLKEPGGGPTPLHQDQHYWPLEVTRAITMWMPLVPVTKEIGSMTFVSGSHRLGYLGNFDISDRSEAEARQLIASRGLEAHTYGALAPGDATFHDGWTMHGAPGNPTAQLREVMTIIYIAADARIAAPRPHQQGDYDLWLQGLRAGDPVAGPAHPVVWP